MARRKEATKLTIVEIIPDLTPEERARRVERFVDTLARVNDITGYAGCKYFPDKGYGEVYIRK